MNWLFLWLILAIALLFAIAYLIDRFKNPLWKNKRIWTPSLISMVAFLITASWILNFFSIIIIPPQTVQITFYSIPLCISGLLFGPFVGVVTGFCEDFLHFFINTNPFPFYPGFTLSACLYGFIFGLLSLFLRNLNTNKWTITWNLLLFVVINLLAILVIWLSFNKFKISTSFFHLKEKFGDKAFLFIILYFFVPFILMLCSWLYIYFFKKTTIEIDFYILNSQIFLSTLIISIVMDNIWVLNLYNLTIEAFQSLIILKLILLPMYYLVKFVGIYFPIKVIKKALKEDTLLTFHGKNKNIQSLN